MIQIHQVYNRKALAIVFEDDEDIDIKVLAVDEAEDLLSQLSHNLQDMEKEE